MTAESAVYAFGPYVLDRPRRLLLREGATVALTPKAFDLLTVLVEHDGQLVPKETLMARLWPETAVEESNLTFQISTLRKALGDGRYVVTVPGRGYHFAGQVQRISGEMVIEQEERTTITVSKEERTSRPWLAIAAVALAVVTAIAAAVVLARRTPAPPPAPPPPAPPGMRSIAVLPFRPIVASQRDEALELGMADTLITRLSHIPSIVTRPTSAIRRYSALDQDPLAAARELGVDSVLDGSIHRSGDRIRITVRLLRTSDGKSLWASQFDQNVRDLFAVQDRVADGIARSIVPTLSGREQQLLSKRLTGNLEAYELYVKGNFYRDVNDYQLARPLYQRAIELDPKFAAAWAGLADTWLIDARYTDSPPHQRFTNARAAAEKAIEIDPELADGHTSLASIYGDYDWRWDDAERAFRRALQLNPNSANAHLRYSTLALHRRKFDVALGHGRRAVELDPRSPSTNLAYANALYASGRTNEAIPLLQQIVRDTRFIPARLHLGMAFMEAGRIDEALEEFRRNAELVIPHTQHKGLYAYALARAGRREEALKLVREIEALSPRVDVAPVNLAMAWTALGDHDRAFYWLERAYRDHLYLLRVINVLRGFDPLRRDPRFADLIRRMGL
jgi:DNA-binding winged helix-turn-helix (wHTH) protein/TolB-like protein/Flp pilus assembly protein TadD